MATQWALKVRVQFDGGRELERALEELPPSVSAKTVMRRALLKAGEPILRTARALAPKKTGRLGISLGSGTVLSKRQRALFPAPKGEVQVYVGVSPKANRYAHLLEFGTRIARARPFMRPAWDAHKIGTLETIRDLMWIEIKKTWVRYVKRQAARKG
jgi:HK97 gp10 family phage protein